MGEQHAEKAQFCETTGETFAQAMDTPAHERGFLLAALANHVRKCVTCKHAVTPPATPNAEEESRG